MTKGIRTVIAVCGIVAVLQCALVRPALAQDVTQLPASQDAPASVAPSRAVEEWIKQNAPAEASEAPAASSAAQAEERVPALSSPTLSGPTLPGPTLPGRTPPPPGGMRSVLPGGFVDWGNGHAAFTAEERLDPALASPARARAMAVRRASLQARKDLLDALLSLPLDGSRTVASALDPAGTAHLRSVVQNSPVQQEEFEADGAMGLAVTAVGELRGELADILLPAAEPFLAGVPPTTELTVASVPAPRLDPEQAAYRASMTELGGFTGLVIDARGLGAAPALLPLVLDPHGVQAYGPFQVSRDDVMENGAAIYVADPANSLLKARTGATPMTVRALAVSGANKTDLVVSEQDARFIRAMFKNEDARHRCAVVVVLDQ